MEEADRYRCRRIYLKHADDPNYKAEAACKALGGVDGIVLAAPHSDSVVHIIYSLDELSFEIVLELLTELDFSIDDSLIMSLRTTLFGYLEDNARDHMHPDGDGHTEADHEDHEVPHPDSDIYWEDYH